MAENTPITVYTAECIGNAANCLYPNEVKITDDFSAKLAFATDMVCARYKNNYRNTANFEVANALPGDCDNDHSEIAADWVTPEDIADLFADVPYFFVASSSVSSIINCAPSFSPAVKAIRSYSAHRHATSPTTTSLSLIGSESRQSRRFLNPSFVWGLSML